MEQIGAVLYASASMRLPENLASRCIMIAATVGVSGREQRGAAGKRWRVRREIFFLGGGAVVGSYRVCVRECLQLTGEGGQLLWRWPLWVFVWVRARATVLGVWVWNNFTLQILSFILGGYSDIINTCIFLLRVFFYLSTAARGKEVGTLLLQLRRGGCVIRWERADGEARERRSQGTSATAKTG